MGILDSRDFVLSLRVQEVMDFDAWFIEVQWMNKCFYASLLLFPMMWPSHICRVTSRVTNSSSQSHLIFSDSRHSQVMTWSSQSEVTRTFESLICKPVSMSIQIQLNIFPMLFRFQVPKCPHPSKQKTFLTLTFQKHLLFGTKLLSCSKLLTYINIQWTSLMRTPQKT